MPNSCIIIDLTQQTIEIKIHCTGASIESVNFGWNMFMICMCTFSLRLLLKCQQVSIGLVMMDFICLLHFKPNLNSIWASRCGLESWKVNLIQPRCDPIQPLQEILVELIWSDLRHRLLYFMQKQHIHMMLTEKCMWCSIIILYQIN